MNQPNEGNTISQQLSGWAESLTPDNLPQATVEKIRDILVDVVGLCVAARHTDYVAGAKASAESGTHIIIGHSERVSPTSAALVNGTAAHGEDFDDTFEGGPVHSGSVVVPALLAAAQAYGLLTKQLVLGLAVGAEVLCRLALTLPKGVHRAGFHPTAVLGVFGATMGICSACQANAKVTTNALGIAGSLASGIIEYLGDGSWTKRMHPGWAAQSALRACAMAEAGFIGPKAVFEGTHGVFNTFAPSIKPRPEQLFKELGRHWVTETIALKPYPCGSMIQPYIDCAIKLKEHGVGFEGLKAIVCKTAEGIVHRLWEPLDLKRRPPTAYAAKFSTPFGIALGLVRGRAGLSDYTKETIRDDTLLNIARLVDYEIDPDDPYPDTFTGHVRLVYVDGRTEEVDQGFVRGGIDNPLSRREIDEKFRANVAYGGSNEADRLLEVCEQISYQQDDYQLIEAFASA